MAVTSVATTDITTVLEDALNDVEGLRAYRYVADNFRPPGAVIALPTITYDDPDAGWCSASWMFPISLIVSRNSDRASQDALSAMVNEVARVLDALGVPSVFSLELQSATPTSVSVAGQDLPAYNLRVLVKA